MDFNLALVEKEGRSEVFCASGILLNKKYVLITSNLFWNEFFKDYKDRLNEHFILINKDKRYKKNIFVKWKESNSMIAKKAKIFAGVINNDLYSTKNLFKDWKIDFEDNSNTSNLPLSLFFVLTISDMEGNVAEFKSMLKGWWDEICTRRIGKGQDIFCSSVSFGNVHFFGSYARGIVSNIVGNNNCLILSDIPSTPGSEGSPVFKLKDHVPFGIIISPLNWWKNEYTGCTLIADLRPILMRLLNLNVGIQETSLNLEVLAGSELSLVKLSCGYSWGSGIIFDKNKGIIITNSHIFDEDDNGIIKINWKNKSSLGTLIYKTPKDSVFDIALVSCSEINEWKVESIKINKESISLGATIYSSGFSLFSSESSLSPTISKGNISQIDEGIIKTTSSVHAGASGGAILNLNGELIGVIVCNIKLPNSSVFPRVNMAVPILKILPIIDKFLIHRDLEVLRTLETSSTKDLNLWKMLKGKL
ncbi:unnamed protein product [Brassicogethes aeneus]|uniref:Peroxisomal leader peptide-processing protease n=1 Tax=Brassicogethes aeneus TaxID=1431903 RepID=A0A9P0FE48_BRAAE|nr:unnamed protein product [Brassicogethes aeneus]